MNTDLPIVQRYMKLSSQLKTLIRSQGMTVVGLSKSTKVPAQTLHNWMSGSPPKNLAHVKKVADHFNVTLDYLLYGIEQKSQTPIETMKEEINAGIFEVILRRVGGKK